MNCRIWFLLVIGLLSARTSVAQDSNRFTYLDEPCNPYYVGRHFPKLTTPQWVEDDGVEAVVVLAIDDMRDTKKYEDYLRPILDRLKQIDGRAPVSIMTNQIDPADEQIQQWLAEGPSIEIHTIDHPCPCLKDEDLVKAKSTYDRCVDLMSAIPGNRPVAYRMPCCDSLNTPSPRFWTEVMHRTTPDGRFLTLDSSVFQVFTQSDPELPGDLLANEEGQSRFRHYIPFPSFVNTIEDYPYPYVIGRMSWQFPCMVPSDWEAQHVQRPNNPKTVADMKIALDLTVMKQGVFNLVFHPHGWIRNDQVVELIDHAHETYGGRVKFMTFGEAQAQINRHLLGNHSLRNDDGHGNGVQLLDLDQDGFLDVVIGQPDKRITRRWDPVLQTWNETSFPYIIHRAANWGTPADSHVRFGVSNQNTTCALGINANGDAEIAIFDDGEWVVQPELQANLDAVPCLTHRDLRPFDGLVLRDVDGEPGTEIVIARESSSEIWKYDADRGWQKLEFRLPSGAVLSWDDVGDRGIRFVDIDKDGFDDVIFSNEQRFGLYRFTSTSEGWTDQIRAGSRGDAGAIPMISRDGINNGAWFHTDHLWVQNEGTHRLPDLVDRMSFVEMLAPPSAAEGKISDEEASTDDPVPEPESSAFSADDPRNMKPSSAAESLRMIKTRPELEVELVASEPLIQDPVAFDWGPDGSLWVVEMGDYPSGVDGNSGGQVRVLRDKDHDGVYDSSTVFLDQLSFPTGIKTWRDGVLITAAPQILFATDTNGDDRADNVETYFDGFVPGNQQHRVNGLRWDLEGWLHVANGDSGGTIHASGDDSQGIDIRGFDLRIEPDSQRVERLTGQTQFGRNRDDWGNWFGGNNSNAMWQFVLEDRYLRRNPHIALPSSRRDVPREAGNSPIFPISVTLQRFNDVHTANRITSACSPIVYRDLVLGEEFYGNSFVCEPVHNLIHREIVSPDGIFLNSQRADDEQQSEFMASSDSWFRPVMIRTGPDGALWVADMYRLVIEHPEWIPAEWQEQLDLRAGHERGRIYRIKRKDQTLEPVPDLASESDDDLVRRLDSTNGWIRDMAQQMLMWREYQNTDEIERILVESNRPQSRLQALYCLFTLGQLSAENLSQAMADSDPRVQAAAIRLSELEYSSESKSLPGELIDAMLKTQLENPIVAYQFACSAGEFDDARISRWLAIALIEFQHDRYLTAALLSSLNHQHIAGVLAGLAGNQQELNSTTWNAVIRTTSGLGEIAWVARQLDSMTEMARNGTLDTSSATLRRIRGLVTGLKRLTEDERTRLAEEVPNWTDSLKAWSEFGWQVAADEEADGRRRINAFELLGEIGLSSPKGIDRAATFIDVTVPIEVQTAAIGALESTVQDRVPVALLGRWGHATPAVRATMLGTLLSRTLWTHSILDSLESGQIKASQISPQSWQRLRLHASDEIKQRANLLADSQVASDRQSLVEQYEAALTLGGDDIRGRMHFEKTCGNCHQLSGVGKAVGPDLSALTDRSPKALMIAMLDPNRAVEDKYLSYTVLTDEGRQFVGLLADETSTTIRLANAEGEYVDILRSQIETIVSSGQSLMPLGLERDLDPQAVADVIAFVRKNSLPSKSFPGNDPQVVEADGDGVIRLNANKARIYGPSIVMEPRYGNLGWWSDETDWAAWDLIVDKADTYEVIFEYASHDNAAGDRYRLTIGEEELRGVVRGTGTWDEYEVRKVGRVHLKPGQFEMVLRSDGPIQTALIDLLEIRLYPFLLDE